jgi:hypothetical protein
MHFSPTRCAVLIIFCFVVTRILQENLFVKVARTKLTIVCLAYCPELQFVSPRKVSLDVAKLSICIYLTISFRLYFQFCRQ